MKKSFKHKAKSDTKKHRKLSKRARSIGVFIIVAGALFMLFGGYGLARQAYYSFKLQGVHAAEFANLQDPLKKFGYTDAASPAPTCTNQEQYGLSGKQLLCVTTADTYTEIGKKDAIIAEFTRQAKELDTKLAENGWETQSSSATSFSEWIQAVSLGNDFSTDINATKDSSGARCILIMTVAYANPNPPAVNTVTSCNAPTYPMTSSGAVISQ